MLGLGHIAGGVVLFKKPLAEAVLRRASLPEDVDFNLSVATHRTAS